MGELKPEDEPRLPAVLAVSEEDPWAVIEHVQTAFADVPGAVHEAEIDRSFVEVRAEARAEAAST